LAINHIFILSCNIGIFSLMTAFGRGCVKTPQ